MSEYIDHTYEDVENVFTQYIHNEKDLDLIRRSYEYAKEKHAGQFRKSGQPYIIHLIEVAYLVSSLHGGPITIASAFLHDTIEDCSITKDDIAREFNLEIADIVFSLTKIKALSHQRRHDPEFVADGHRKIFLGMAKDIRVIIIKLCDRLHNMRTLDFQTPEKKISISRETLDVYAPIADRLGFNEIKSELQDLCLRYLEPDAYAEIKNYLATKIKYKEESIQKLSKKIADMLIPTGIPFEILARVKHPYSIWKKMKSKNLTFDTIYDIVAIRVITESELNCYEILGLIHSNYTPLPGRFKDYIAVPKTNLYQSLHTTIIDHDSTIIEIQIRTKEMNDVAENGIAAHWRYKEGTKYDPKKEQQEIMEKLHWFSDFVSLSNNSTESSKEYMESLSKDIFGDNIYCFTPNGKVIDLPKGATPLDFAFKVHTKVGLCAVGALVNSQLVPLSTELKTGDVVSIKTSTTENVNERWLKIVKTSSAKNIIRKNLAKKNAEFLREANIQKGKESLMDAFREHSVPEGKFSSYMTNDLYAHFEMNTEEDFFLAVANKTITPTSVIDYLGIRNESSLTSFIKKNTFEKATFSKQSVLVKGTPNILCTLSACCSPIPGDDIVGYVSQGKGVKVHRKDCPNITRALNRTIEVEWNPNCTEIVAPIQLSIKATDRESLIVDILNCLSQNKIPCTKIVAKNHTETHTVTINVTLNVKNFMQYNDIRNVLINIESVYSIERVTH